MKFVSWNVNGLRACLTKGFEDFFNEVDADFFCIQETKLQQDQMSFYPKGYFTYLSCAEKKGYSGTAIFTKHEPICVTYGIDGKYSDEGRVITLEYADFYLVNCYVPNSQDGLKRLDYRMEFEDIMGDYLKKLSLKKSVLYCGDLNVAHKEIDLKNPASNHHNPGFTDEEREKLTKLLDRGFTDTFRHFYPDKAEAYSWWSYRFKSRERNAGWRIDYFVVSDDLKDKLKSAVIYSHILGSDHCPVGVEI